MRTLAFVADQQPFAMHDLHQPQHRAVGQVGAFGLHGFMHLFDGGRTSGHRACSRSSSAVVGLFVVNFRIDAESRQLCIDSG